MATIQPSQTCTVPATRSEKGVSNAGDCPAPKVASSPIGAAIDSFRASGDRKTLLTTLDPLVAAVTVPAADLKAIKSVYDESESWSGAKKSLFEAGMGLVTGKNYGTIDHLRLGAVLLKAQGTAGPLGQPVREWEQRLSAAPSTSALKAELDKLAKENQAVEAVLTTATQARALEEPEFKAITAEHASQQALLQQHTDRLLTLRLGEDPAASQAVANLDRQLAKTTATLERVQQLHGLLADALPAVVTLRKTAAQVRATEQNVETTGSIYGAYSEKLSTAAVPHVREGRKITEAARVDWEEARTAAWEAKQAHAAAYQNAERTLANVAAAVEPLRSEIDPGYLPALLALGPVHAAKDGSGVGFDIVSTPTGNHPSAEDFLTSGIEKLEASKTSLDATHRQLTTERQHVVDQVLARD